MFQNRFVRTLVAACTRWIRLTVFLALVLGLTPVVAPAAGADPGPEVMSETFRIGPFDLAPQGQPGDQINRLFEDAPRPSGDLAVRSITWDFVDGDGNPLPDHVAHLHHLVLLDSARPDQLCSFPSASRFAGTGKELTDFVLPDGYAYLSPDAPWSSVYHVMNMSDAPVEAAIEYTVSWTDPADGGFDDVEPYFLDVTGCWGNSEYPVPGDGGPGSVHEQARTYTIDREGVAVVAGGHLHAGGVDLALSRNGEELCRAEAIYHDEGHDGHAGHGRLDTVTACGVLEEPLAVGDQLRLVSRYRNDTAVQGAMGIMVAYVHHTGPPPPPPTVEIGAVTLVEGVLTGTVVCNRPLDVNVDGSVVQDKGGPPISWYGYAEEAVTCGTDPTPFRVDLTYGNGALTGGSVAYSVFAWAFDGRDQAYDEVSGETRARGRTEPRPDVEPGGPLEIRIDPKSPGPGMVAGTITCDTPAEVSINIQGRQKLGRHFVEAYGWSVLTCDGETTFEVELEAYGRLAGGPIDLVVHVYDQYEFEPSVMTGTVILSGTTRSETIALPPPDPDSHAQILGAVSTPDGVEVTVTHDACPAGAEYYVWVSGRDARRGQGGRLSEPTTAYGQAQGTCDGTLLSVPVLVPFGKQTKALELWAQVDWYDPGSGAYGYDWNTAEVAVTRR